MKFDIGDLVRLNTHPFKRYVVTGYRLETDEISPAVECLAFVSDHPPTNVFIHADLLELKEAFQDRKRKPDTATVVEGVLI